MTTAISRSAERRQREQEKENSKQILQKTDDLLVSIDEVLGEPIRESAATNIRD